MRRRPRGSVTSTRSPARTQLRRLRRLGVDVHLAAIARRRGQAARLEHSRRPQPLVRADRIERGAARGDGIIGAEGARTMARVRRGWSPLVFAAAAWAADVVVDNWKSQKLGAQGYSRGLGRRPDLGLPQHDMTIEENDGHRVLHLRARSRARPSGRTSRARSTSRRRRSSNGRGRRSPCRRTATAERRPPTTRRRSSTWSGRASPRRSGRRSSATSGTRPRRPGPS